MRRKLPLALDPPHIARRVAMQHSHFTIHGTDPMGLMTLRNHARNRLVKIALPQASIEQTRVDLYTCGVTDSVIFPDLEGLSRELTRYFTDTW